MERRLAAILAADVVGYSRLMGEDETGTLAALKALRAELVAPTIADHKGRVVKVMGDGLLAEFGSVVEAVECAVAIQAGIMERNEGTTQGREVLLRIGINLGDVIVEGRDIYGDGVNVAARLEALAESGGICISDTVHQNVRNKLELVFDDLGPQQLKNIPDPVRVYRIVFDDTAAEPAARPESPLPASDKPSIAVLAFNNMSGDPEQDYFSDGISEDIITELSRFREFLVIARNSSFRYKGQSPKIEDVTRDLGVRYVVEGSVRRAGERVRVNAQLIDAHDGSHIWADRYDRNLADIFPIQDEVTEAVVARIADSVRGAGAALSRSRPTESMTAYDLVLQSRLYRTAIKRTSNEEAARLLKKAIALDPSYALAHASLAFVLVGDYDEGWTADPQTTLNEALAAARKAVSLDNSDGYAHASLAYVDQTLGNFDRAHSEIQTALRLNPNHVNIVMTAGWISIVVGDPAAGITYIQRAQRLNPYMGGFATWTLGLGYFGAKRYEEAVDTFLQVSDPPTSLYLALASSYAYLGRETESRAALRTFLDLAKGEIVPFPGDDPEGWRAFLTRTNTRQLEKDLDHIFEGARLAGLPVGYAQPS